MDVASNKPQVFSAEYPAYTPSGGVGIPGTFTFTSPLPGVTAYTYSFDSAPPVTVPADADGSESTVPPGPDGTAAIEFTVPADQPSGRYVVLRLWSINEAGQGGGERG